MLGRRIEECSTFLQAERRCSPALMASTAACCGRALGCTPCTPPAGWTARIAGARWGGGTLSAWPGRPAQPHWRCCMCPTRRCLPACKDCGASPRAMQDAATVNCGIPLYILRHIMMPHSHNFRKPVRLHSRRRPPRCSALRLNDCVRCRACSPLQCSSRGSAGGSQRRERRRRQLLQHRQPLLQLLRPGQHFRSSPHRKTLPCKIFVMCIFCGITAYVQYIHSCPLLVF